MKHTIFVYSPNKKFRAISLTGTNCWLHCKHCNGKYLRGMIAAPTPAALLKVAEALYNKDVNGLLLSGGCTPDGKVPMTEFYPAIRKIKKEFGMALNVHTGLIDRVEAEKLAATDVDTVSFDIIGDNATIREVAGLNKTVEDYRNSLTALIAAGLNVVPHLCIGLYYGTISGEYNAVDIISDFGLKKMIFITLLSTRETVFAELRPPRTQEVVAVVRYAHTIMPDCSLRLGCMCRRERELIMNCISAGIEGIVSPRPEIVAQLREKNYIIEHRDTCCSL